MQMLSYDRRGIYGAVILDGEFKGLSYGACAAAGESCTRREARAMEIKILRADAAELRERAAALDRRIAALVAEDPMAKLTAPGGE